jgi:hypothetical protein
METVEFGLLDIWPKKHRNHVAEMRGLKFVLHENKMLKYYFPLEGIVQDGKPSAGYGLLNFF